jgi:RNA polymerase sigma-70 factor (ECF subfamily)
VQEVSQLVAELNDLMELYGRAVWNLAFSLTQRADLADDITQDVFLKVHQKLAVFRGDASVKTWILQIARNTALDYRRSAYWRRVLPFGVTPERGESPSAEKQAIEALVQAEAWQAVFTLPVKYREVLVLYAHHQLTVPEIAELLGVTETTVKSRLQRARNKARGLLKGE